MSTTGNGKYYIPYRVTESDFATMRITKEDTRVFIIGKKIILVCFVPTDEETVYEGCVREFYNELKREWRLQKCVIPDGRGGLKICKGCCKECPKNRESRECSYDVEVERGLEVEDPSNFVDDLIDRLTLDALMAKLRKQDPYSAYVLDLILDDKSERDLVDVLNRSKSNVHYVVSKAKEALKDLYNEK